MNTLPDKVKILLYFASALQYRVMMDTHKKTWRYGRDCALLAYLLCDKIPCRKGLEKLVVCQTGQSAFLVYGIAANGKGEGRNVLVYRWLAGEAAYRLDQRFALLARYVIGDFHCDGRFRCGRDFFHHRFFAGLPGFRLRFLCRLRLLRRLDDGRQQVGLDDGQRRYALSAKYPHYSAQETQGKINHFLESDTKPMICSMIAQKGFVCPRLANGSFACNAPAALCYQPLDVDTLRELLAKEPVTGKTVEDALSAQRFIKGYLYNVDSVLAGTFLQYELRQRFGLKAMDMNPLEALQKELYRAWKSAKDTKREAGRNELPDWYELTENGGLRFLSSILADHMSKEVATFYGAGSFYVMKAAYTEPRTICGLPTRCASICWPAVRYLTPSMIRRDNGRCSSIGPSGTSIRIRSL